MLNGDDGSRQVALQWEAKPGATARRAPSTPAMRLRTERPATARRKSDSRLANAIRMLKTGTYGNRLAR